MSEDTSLTHTEQAMAYYGGDLTAEEKAAFEVHLAGCAECRKLLAEAEAALPVAEGLLAMELFKPKRSVEEQVRRFDALVKEEKAERARRWRVATYALAAALAAFLVGAAFVALRPSPRPGQRMVAPLAPSDGGR